MTTHNWRRQWPTRRVWTALAAAAGLAVAVGVPTGIVPTALYTRMTPVLWWNYPIWAVTAVLGGLIVATYIRRPGDRRPRSGAGAASGGGLLTAFAVGCPVCNKLVVAALGVSGALTIWAPIQPVLGLLSVAGLAWLLRRRLRNEFACPAPVPPRRASEDGAADERSFVGPFPTAEPLGSPWKPTAAVPATPPQFAD